MIERKHRDVPLVRSFLLDKNICQARMAAIPDAAPVANHTSDPPRSAMILQSLKMETSYSTAVELRSQESACDEHEAMAGRTLGIGWGGDVGMG